MKPLELNWLLEILQKFHQKKKLYLLEFTVEWDAVDIDKIMGLEDKDYNGDDEYDDDNIMDDEILEMEKNRGTTNKNYGKSGTKTSTSGSASAPPKTTQVCSYQNLVCANLIDSDDNDEALGFCDKKNRQELVPTGETQNPVPDNNNGDVINDKET